MPTSDRLLFYAHRLYLGQLERTIRLGKDKSHVASAVIVEKRVYDEASAWSKNEDRKDRVYLGCNVIRENILACALESMKRTSSFPGTKHACVMDTPTL